MQNSYVFTYGGARTDKLLLSKNGAILECDHCSAKFKI